MAKKKKKSVMTKEQQYEQMVARYGYSVKWVDVEMYLTYDEMMEYFGRQCKEYEPNCSNCTNWVLWNKTGKAVVSFERDELLKIL